MKLFFRFLLLMLSLILFVEIGTASNPYGEIYEYDLYFNGKLLEVDEVPHPTLKIGEPFEIRIDFTVYQECYVSTMISEIGEGNFIIIQGPTERTNDYCGKIIGKNSTETFEWIVAPTEDWAGGSLPIDFIYQIDELGANGKTLLNSGFTVAYPYISTEYYEEKISTNPQSSAPQTEHPPEATPGFMVLLTLIALVYAVSRH